MSASNISTLLPKKLPCLNLVEQLKKRETHSSRPGTQFHVARNFYSTIFPNCTVINVEKPPCFLRKFSPDGRFFIAFSSDQTSIEIYEFQGSAAAENILCDFKDEVIGPSQQQSQANYARTVLFSRFFRQKHVTNVSHNGEHLNRECSLFTEDMRYIIVGSAVQVAEDPHPQFHDIYRNNESVSPSVRFPLEDYTLHIVELETGRLCDNKHFKCDKIFLSHNQGLYLYKDILAVLSVQQQTIHILQVLPCGQFVEIRRLGQFCFEDDQLVLSSIVSSSVDDMPFRQVTINSLKHKLLVFLFQHAKRRSEIDGSATAMLQFFQNFDQYRLLRMWRMQLLTETCLLIKYASEDIVTLRISDSRSQPSLFVVYDMAEARVTAVYENTSERFLDTYENFCDFFRNATMDSQSQFTCSPSSNIHARQIHQRFKQTIINAKFGGQTEAIKHLLAQLPISAQSYSCSPYLDLTLFSYDDKWISVMERPKSCGDYPIRLVSCVLSITSFKAHYKKIQL